VISAAALRCVGRLHLHFCASPGRDAAWGSTGAANPTRTLPKELGLGRGAWLAILRFARDFEGCSDHG
jgi:hypothetical protein